MASVLAETLRRLRALQGDSLRDVEKATKVSNAYLSQLETGATENPSPRVLHTLAAYYDVPYEGLLEAAGYLTKRPSNATAAELGAAGAALMSAKLTDAEEQQVVAFIEFLRSQRRSRKRSTKGL